MKWLTQFARDWADGLRVGLDALFWGQPYPRTIDLRALERMKRH